MVRPNFYETIICFLVTLHLSVSAFAQLDSVVVRLNQYAPQPKELADLAEVKSLQQKKKYLECAKKSAALEKKYFKIRTWIILQRLSCIGQAQRENVRASNEEMAQALHSVWKNREILNSGLAARSLRTQFYDGSMRLIENEIAKNKERTWVWITQLLELREFWSSKQLAKVYRWAGELSLLEQNRNASRDFFERSLFEDPSDKEVQKRLDVVLKTLNLPASSEAVVAEAPAESPHPPGEVELLKRMEQMQSSGDYVAAVEDGVRILKEYPGSKNSSDVARKILAIYLGVAVKSEDRFQSLRERIVREMKKVDGQRLYDWSVQIHSREYFSDAHEFAKASVEQLGSQPFLTQVLQMTALSAYYMGDMKSARVQFERLIKEHAGSKAAMDADFRLGLMNYREGRFAEAISQFQRYLRLDGDDEFELSSLYWSWRAQQKLEAANKPDVPASDAFAQRIIDRYPMSYYGLRARAALNGNKIKWNESLKSAIQWNFYFTGSEKDSWDRYLLLMRAGWSSEARDELKTISEPQRPEGRVVYAQLQAAAQNFYSSAEILAKIFPQQPNYFVPDILKIVYPNLYIEPIKKESGRYNISPFLVLGVIRQESSFRVDVVSPAGAVGLMQLMPGTAREVAQDMRIKISDASTDLTSPEINIRIGTQYLNRRIRAFDGSVPLALASYNAGIGNVRNWLRARADLKDLSKVQSSEPDAELWFDELPWAETSGYIKSILRNYLIYRTLDQGEVTLGSPIWLN